MLKLFVSAFMFILLTAFSNSTYLLADNQLDDSPQQAKKLNNSNSKAAVPDSKVLSQKTSQRKANRSNTYTHLVPVIHYLLQDDSAINSNSVSFSCGWETGIQDNGCWDETNEINDYSIQIVSNPVRKGEHAARFEVRPGDDPLSTPGNPCIGCGERAEVADMTTQEGGEIDETKDSGTQYYAFSVMFDENWTNPKADSDGLWTHFFQLHGPDILDASAAFAMDTNASDATDTTASEGISIVLRTGDLDDDANSLQWLTFDLSDNRLNKGHWIDFIIRIKFALDYTGSVDVWRRDDNENNFSQVLSTQNIYGGGLPTLQSRSSCVADDCQKHYWKHGIYRPKQDLNSGQVNILWVDGMTRGSNFDAVKEAAFP